MTIIEHLTQDIIASQKAGQADKLMTLRLMMNALKNKAKDLRIDSLDDNQATAVLQKEVKKRKESILAFEQAKRQDLVDKETAELEILLAYVPAELTDEQIAGLVTKIVTEQSLTAPYDFGKLMGAVMKEVNGRADGQRVRAAVQNYIDNKN